MNSKNLATKTDYSSIVPSASQKQSIVDEFIKRANAEFLNEATRLWAAELVKGNVKGTSSCTSLEIQKMKSWAEELGLTIDFKG